MTLKGEDRRAYNRRRREAWRERVLEYLGGECVVCGSTDQLNIHHKRGTDVAFKLSGAWCWKWERQVAELAKCELRCDTHHREDYAAEHGTKSGYGSGCRCDACVNARRKYNREWMAASRAG